MLERSFAQLLETGGMRRTHLRFHHNIAKRMLIHVAGFNLGLLMRKRFGVGTPRGLQCPLAAAMAVFVAPSTSSASYSSCRATGHPPIAITDSTWLASGRRRADALRVHFGLQPLRLLPVRDGNDRRVRTLEEDPPEREDSAFKRLFHTRLLRPEHAGRSEDSRTPVRAATPTARRPARRFPPRRRSCCTAPGPCRWRGFQSSLGRRDLAGMRFAWRRG